MERERDKKVLKDMRKAKCPTCKQTLTLLHAERIKIDSLWRAEFKCEGCKEKWKIEYEWNTLW